MRSQEVNVRAVEMFQREIPGERLSVSRGGVNGQDVNDSDSIGGLMDGI